MSFSDIGNVPQTELLYICGRCGKRVKRDSLEALLKLGWTVHTYERGDVARTVYFCSARHAMTYHLKRL